MVKEIVLPVRAFMHRQIPFPVADNSPHRGILWKRDNGVKVIRHQQHQSAMPFEFVMVEPCGLQSSISPTGVTELVRPTNGTLDRDEKETAFLNPDRHFMRKFFPRCKPHAKSCAKAGNT